MAYEPSTFALEEAKASCFENLVGTPGFEPGASALSEPRSNQLSYVPRFSKYITTLLAHEVVAARRVFGSEGGINR